MDIVCYRISRTLTYMDLLSLTPYLGLGLYKEAVFFADIKKHVATFLVWLLVFGAYVIKYMCRNWQIVLSSYINYSVQ